MKDFYFIWNGKNSRDFGIRIKHMPNRTRPARRGTTIEVPFRDGNLTFDEGVYNTFTVDIECMVIHNFTSAHIRDIKEWLFKPSGNLIMSDNFDVIYRATIFNKIDFTEIFDTTGSFLLTFECQPFGTYAGGNEPILLTEKVNDLYSISPVESYPYFKLVGDGDLELRVNEVDIVFKDVEGYIEIDSELLECYKDNTLCNRKMTGRFPTLRHGSNYVGHTGTELWCIPRWRLL